MKPTISTAQKSPVVPLTPKLFPTKSLAVQDCWSPHNLLFNSEVKVPALARKNSQSSLLGRRPRFNSGESLSEADVGLSELDHPSAAAPPRKVRKFTSGFGTANASAT